MTRAKKRLFLTAADYYGTGRRQKKLSPYIFEALPTLAESKTKKQAEQLSLGQILSVYEEREEKEEKRAPLKLSYITYSNLQMFDICPLHYKAKAIFNIPTPPAAVQSFGISLHNTLYSFYRRIREGETPSLAEVLELLKKEWLTDGYDGKKHEQERWEQAGKILSDFYKTEGPKFVKPLELELPFNFTLKNGVKVFGKIDRVDPCGRGIEIIDYKTGEENPKAQTSHELQLKIYALAATRVKDDILNRAPKDITLTIHFLEGNTKKSMNFTKEDLDKLEDDLIKKIEEIEKSDFKCSGNILCKTCEYKILCNAN
jgi:DNA helicase-2/ATP-dependent DNA helicase PcrA